MCLCVYTYVYGIINNSICIVYITYMCSVCKVDVYYMYSICITYVYKLKQAYPKPYDSNKRRGLIEESIPPCMRIASGYAFLTRWGMRTPLASGLSKLD